MNHFNSKAFRLYLGCFRNSRIKTSAGILIEISQVTVERLSVYPVKANREPRETGMSRDQLADRPFLKNGGCDCKHLLSAFEAQEG